MYWNQGELMVLHVPMEKPLSHEDKEALQTILKTWGYTVPSSWEDPEAEDGVYLELVEGYVLDHCMIKKPLKDVFQPNDAVEQYVQMLEKYDDVTQHMRDACGRGDLLVAKNKVGYVSFNPRE